MIPAWHSLAVVVYGGSRAKFEPLLVRSELNRNFSPENFSYLGKCVILSD